MSADGANLSRGSFPELSDQSERTAEPSHRATGLSLVRRPRPLDANSSNGGFSAIEMNRAMTAVGRHQPTGNCSSCRHIYEVTQQPLWRRPVVAQYDSQRQLSAQLQLALHPFGLRCVLRAVQLAWLRRSGGGSNKCGGEGSATCLQRDALSAVEAATSCRIASPMPGVSGSQLWRGPTSMPPSTTRWVPVTKAASSLAR
jgi:hypothetical protein